VWTKSSDGASSMYRRTYSAAGVGAALATPMVGWSALAADPVPREIGTAVSGLRGTPGGASYWDGKAFLVDGAGSTLGTLSSGLNAYLGEHDLDVVAGVPVYVYSRTDQGKILLHTGLDPVGAGSTGTPGPGPEHEVAAGGCCMYYPSYRYSWWIADSGTGANADSGGWLAWYSNSSTQAEQGWLVRAVDGLPAAPVLGPVQQAPGALTGGGSASATQRAALARSATSGAWFAYPVGYPTARSIRIWNLGTANVLTLKPGHAVTHVAIASDPTGRLWLTYFSPDTDEVYTSRSNKSLTAFGPPAAIGHPVPAGGYLYSTAIDAVSQHADVVVNSGDALYHRQSLPTLNAVWKVVKSKTKLLLVKVTVTDAGDPVAGSKVRIGKSGATTSGSGKATLKIKKGASLPKKLRGKASKTGYFTARFTVKAK
jgi:hypothetical protein